jgi:hypothetical protein
VSSTPLFDFPPSPPPADDYSRPLRRNSDPATSHEAARYAADRLGEWHQRALEAVRGCQGGTASEIAASIGDATNHNLSRRLPELERLGLVVRGPARECRVTHRSAATWRMA